VLHDRKLFADERKHQPGYLIASSMPSAPSARGHGFNLVAGSAAQQLLVSWTASEGAEQVVVMWRPTVSRSSTRLFFAPRFDRRCCAPPDIDGASPIPACNTRGKPPTPTSICESSRSDERPHPARVANHLNEAAIFADRRDDNWVTQMDFEAPSRRVAGLQQRRLSPKRAANPLVHEGGPRADGASDGLRDGAPEVTIVRAATHRRRLLICRKRSVPAKKES